MVVKSPAPEDNNQDKIPTKAKKTKAPAPKQTMLPSIPKVIKQKLPKVTLEEPVTKIPMYQMFVNMTYLINDQNKLMYAHDIDSPSFMEMMIITTLN